MATQSQLIFEILRFSNLNNNVSKYISTHLMGKVVAISTIATLGDIAAYPFVLDDTLYPGIVAADLVGLGYFTNIQTIILPAATVAMPQATIDAAQFPNIKVLKDINGSGTVFTGNMSGFTSLTTIWLNIGSASAAGITPPILSNNPNLDTVFLVSFIGAFSWGITNIGNLSGLTKLKSYTLSAASSVTQATINNILSTLRAAKTAGAPLVTVNLTNTKAPTGGSSNADYVALVAAGVTVTLGTL